MQILDLRPSDAGFEFYVERADGQDTFSSVGYPETSEISPTFSAQAMWYLL